VLQKANPEAAAILMKKATAWTASRFEYYQKLAALTYEKK
jgi:pyruvate-ferredoxin/flavodoxin oxidoreductase